MFISIHTPILLLYVYSFYYLKNKIQLHYTSFPSLFPILNTPCSCSLVNSQSDDICICYVKFMSWQIFYSFWWKGVVSKFAFIKCLKLVSKPRAMDYQFRLYFVSFPAQKNNTWKVKQAFYFSTHFTRTSCMNSRKLGHIYSPFFWLTLWWFEQEWAS